jgi:predicted nuclease of predicted toxin-antitoxin system
VAAELRAGPRAARRANAESRRERLRLLLDEHFDYAVAEQLRSRGIDALAVTERPELKQASDRALLRIATDERRVIVTNNVRDFVTLVEAFGLARETQFGVLLTHNRTFPRTDDGMGSLVRSLAAFVADKDEDWLRDGCMYLPPA